MSGSHVAPPSHQHSSNSHKSSGSGSGSGWKVAVLVIVLLIAIAALVFLLYQLFGDTIMEKLGLGTEQTATVAEGVFTQIGAEYSDGKNVAGNLTVNPGTQRPPEIPAEAEDVILLDISWTGSKEQTEPVYLTVSDPSFTDGDGLSVYEYDQPQATWEQVGTYRIANNAVTFQADDMTSFAFQVISSTPVAPTASPIPEPTAEPTPSPEPTPEPTPAPAVVMDYGSYPTVQTGAYTMASAIEDDGVYVLAQIPELPGVTVTTGGADGQNGSAGDGGANDGVVFTQVEAPDDTSAEGGDAAAAEAPAEPTYTATVLMNKGDGTLAAVAMPLVQTDTGAWCLAGPITDGMLWTADRDIYSGGQFRFSLGNHDKYLNTNDDVSGIILTDNSVRTRWLIENVTLASGGQISTVTYGGDNSKVCYISDMSNVVEALSDSLFPAGEVPAEPNPQATQITYLGTAAPADQTMLRESLHFSVTSEEGQSTHLAMFKLDPSATVPADAQTMPVSSITVPIIDENSNLSMLDIRDGTNLLQLGVDYTIAAKVYNNSTVVVVLNFMGKYTGQIVRSYPGTFFRTDASQATPSPEPSATPEPTAEPTAVPNNNSGGNTGSTGGNGGGTTNWVPNTTPTQNPSSPTDTQTYDDPTDS